MDYVWIFTHSRVSILTSSLKQRYCNLCVSTMWRYFISSSICLEFALLVFDKIVVKNSFYWCIDTNEYYEKCLWYEVNNDIYVFDKTNLINNFGF